MMKHENAEDGGGPSRRVHLVLSAGGVKCASYAGAVTVLKENNISFASVSGISAGSFIGAILCSRVGLEGFQKAVYNLDLMKLGEGASWPAFLNLVRKPLAKYKETRVAEAFRNVVGGDPTFEELSTPFATFGVDLRTNKIHVYSRKATPKMRVAEALRISTAAPFLFPPQEDGENLVLDGAIVSQSPVWLATVYDDDLPILILRPKKDPAAPPPAGPMEYILRLIDLGGGSRDYYLIKQIPRARLVDIDCADIKFDQFDLTKEMKNSLVISGRVAMEDSLKDLLDDLQRGPHQPRPAPARDEAGAGAGGGAAGRPPARAERGAEAALNSVISSLAPKREQVFISYSHKDAKWLRLFQEALHPYIRSRAVTLWDDTQIHKGARWEEEIKRAMAAAKVAVLLVTRNYLASKYVWEVELKEFLRASKDDGLKVLPVIVGASAYPDTELSAIQAVNSLDIPLKKLDEAALDEELVRICREIKEVLEA
jgi:predicted acylesterase/phospholipase RssA